MIPASSTLVPTMNPGTSIRKTSGSPNALQRLTKRAALSAESLSRMPPSWRGWLPTIPTGRPPIRARQVMIVFANCGLRSSHAPRRRHLAVRREERQVLLDARDALLIVGHLEVADARLAAVHARAAELLLRDVLADRGTHEVRAGQRHRAAALDHRDEVGESGDVGGARRARAHQRGDLRDHAAHHHLFFEQVARAGEQRADGLL